MHATLANISPLQRTGWLTLTVPAAADLGPEIDFVAAGGTRWRGVRGRTAGLRTVYRVHATLPGHTRVTGQLVPAARQPVDFTPHRWVVDDIDALIPKFGVRVVEPDGRTVDVWADPATLNQVDQSPAHRRFRYVSRIPSLGVYFVFFVDMLHDDPVMPFVGKMVWSHRADPSPMRRFEFVAVQSGEWMAFDYAKSLGVNEPLPRPGGGWLRVLNREPITLQDGAAIAFSGSMLTYRQKAEITTDDERAVGNIMAAAQGPLVGVCNEWADRWLANRNVPRLVGSFETDWQLFKSLTESYRGWFGPRLIGSDMVPSSTGDQEDFGATKGTHAVAYGDPRWIYAARWSVYAEFLRGLQHYEDDGKIMRATDHPQWITWSGVTHWHTGVSPDRLGKTITPPVPFGTGYVPHDDQHRSHNNLAALIALGDDPLLDELLVHMGETDVAAYRVEFPSFGVDAARAQGRVAQALSQLISVANDSDRLTLLAALTARLAPINSNALLQVAGPMKVLAYGEPDLRKEVYNLDGTRGPWVCFWEHGLAMVGLYIAWKQHGTDSLAATLTTVAKTLATFGCFQANDGKWHTVGDMLWRNGEAPPNIAPLSPQLTSLPIVTDVLTWTFAGLLAAREWLQDRDDQLCAKLDDYIEHVTHGSEAQSRREAEWWAVVKRVPPGAVSS